MSTASLPSLEPARLETPTLAWRSWPLVDNWASAVPLVGASIATVVLVAAQTGKPELVAIAALAILVSAWSWWMPVWYQISSLGIRRTILGRPRHLPWRLIRRCRLGEEGALLLATLEPSPLDWLRGTYIRYGPHRAEIIAMIEHNLRAPEPPRSASGSRSRRSGSRSNPASKARSGPAAADSAATRSLLDS